MVYYNMKIDTNKVKVGQEFKSMQELSLALTGEKLPRGSAYNTRVNLFKRYLSWVPIPGSYKVVVSEIYPEPKPKQSKSLYSPQILSNLLALDQSKDYTLYDLFLSLGFVNERFTKSKFYAKNINELKIPFVKYNSLHSEITISLKTMLFQFFNTMSSKSVLTFTTNYIYDKEPIEEPPIEEIKASALKESSYDSEWAVLHSKEKDKYQKQIKEALFLYGVNSYYKSYSFKITNTPVELPAPDINRMNELILQKLKKHYKNNPTALKLIDTIIPLHRLEQSEKPG